MTIKMATAHEVKGYCLHKAGAWQDEPWEGDVVAKVGSKIFAFLGNLAEQGKRPWAEIFYPPPARLAPVDRADWEARQLDAFDAVELVDGELVTLPPYAELVGPAEGGGAA